MKQTELSERLWNVAAHVGKVVDALPETRLGRHVAGQLVRCGTSSAPNYDESGASESRDDFIHKVSIALKELRETRGWLRFVVKSQLLAETKLGDLIDETEQLCRTLGKSVLTAKSARTNSQNDRFQMPDARSQDSPSQDSPFLHNGLDHLAIVVPDTDEALDVWQKTFGFPLLYSEIVNNGAVRLTHLDLGNTHLQLVQPLTAEHPLHAWLAKNGGPGLHHFCLNVANVGDAHAALPVIAGTAPHQGTQGKRALFLDRTATQGVQVEVTGR